MLVFGYGGGPSNNFTIYDQSSGANGGGTIPPSQTSEVGLTAAPAALTPGETTLIQLVIGDSISANSGASAYVPTNVKNEMLNPYTGNNWRYKDPVVGASQGPGSYPGRIADKLIDAAAFARVITIDVSVGGSASSDWAKTGPFCHRARVGILWAKSLGWPIGGSADSWRFAVIYACGTNDNAINTTGPAFEANALSCFQSLRDYGCNAPIFISKMTLFANDADIDPAIQAAQAALVDNGQGRYLGADVDSLTTNTNRQAGNYPHLTDTGNDNLAGLWSAIFQAHF